jgi:hypothetical protein
VGRIGKRVLFRDYSAWRANSNLPFIWVRADLSRTLSWLIREERGQLLLDASSVAAASSVNSSLFRP